MSFLCPGCSLGHHVTFSCHVCLGSSWLLQFLRLSLFVIFLTVLRRSCKCTSVEIVCCFSHEQTEVIRNVGEEDHGGKCPFHHIIERVHTINRTYSDVNLGLLVDVVFVRFLHWEIIPAPSFHTTFFVRNSPCAAHIYGVGS